MRLKYGAMVGSFHKGAPQGRLDLVSTTHVDPLQSLRRVHGFDHRHRDPRLSQVVDQFQQLWDHGLQCTLPASEPISTQVIDAR